MTSPVSKPDPQRRSYNQWCGVAKGLDLVGERWTLLIVRDLLLGPKRYKDLLEGLPGLGTNLLAVRLREMESCGLIRRRTLPPPAASRVYELTPSGESLRPALIAIGQLGAQFLREPEPDDTFPVTAHFLAMRSNLDRERAGNLDRTYELRVGGQVYEVELRKGKCLVREQAADRPDLIMEMSPRTFNGLLRVASDPGAAIDARELTVIHGEPREARRFFSIFNLSKLLSEHGAGCSTQDIPETGD